MSKKTKHIIVAIQWTLFFCLLGYFAVSTGVLEDYEDYFPLTLIFTPLHLSIVAGFLVLNILVTVLIYKGKGIFTQEKI